MYGQQCNFENAGLTVPKHRHKIWQVSRTQLCTTFWKTDFRYLSPKIYDTLCIFSYHYIQWNKKIQTYILPKNINESVRNLGTYGHRKFCQLKLFFMWQFPLIQKCRI